MPVSQYRRNVVWNKADAHMKRQIMDREVVVAITEGDLTLETWDGYFTMRSAEYGVNGCSLKSLESDKV